MAGPDELPETREVESKGFLGLDDFGIDPGEFKELGSKAASLAAENLPLNAQIKVVYRNLKKMPDGAEWSGDFLKGGKGAVNEFLEGISSIHINGERVVLVRDETKQLVINRELGLAVTVDSIEISQVSFELAGNEDSPVLANIKGASIKAQIAGMDISMDIEEIAVNPDDKGNLVLKAKIDHPLPESVEFVASRGSVPVEIVIDKDGKMQSTKPGDFFNPPWLWAWTLPWHLEEVKDMVDTIFARMKRLNEELSRQQTKTPAPALPEIRRVPDRSPRQSVIGG